MNMAPDRKRAPDKIDDMVALLMSFGEALAHNQPQREYQILFV
jgi:hypothetical protein